MPHEPGHTNENTTYKVYGTNKPYSGMTVEIGGFLYSTVGGALEGDSMQLVSLDGGPNVDPNQMSNVDVTVPNTSTPGNAQNNNPVVRTFRNRRDGSNRLEYLRLDGSDAAMLLHEHMDGTIMEGHDPNQMGVIVELNPSFDISVNRNGTGGGTTTPSSTTPTPRSGGGGMSGGGY